MLGRKTYTPDELDTATTAVDRQLAAYKKLVRAIDTSDPPVASALADFEPLFFNHMTLALDRYFVHRVRMVTGKDGTPLNEVELVVDSLLTNGGILRDSNVIKLVPDESVLRLRVGDRIRVSAKEFERLSKAVLAEVREKFV